MRQTRSKLVLNQDYTWSTPGPNMVYAKAKLVKKTGLDQDFIGPKQGLNQVYTRT